jgi:hypothetical protein
MLGSQSDWTGRPAVVDRIGIDRLTAVMAAAGAHRRIDGDRR